MIRVHFILGFLGAGKTTLIKSFLRSVPDLSRVQLIVNDFGQERFDSELLKEDGADAVEISQGCLCCGLMESFRQVLIENANRTDIDRIIIEPSGIFIPDDVLRIFKEPSIEDKLVLEPITKIINTALFIEKDLTRLPFIVKQIRCSHRIVMNRMTGIERSVKNTFKEKLLSINPSLEILEEPGEVGIRGLFSSRKASHGVFASEIADQQKTESHDHPFYSIQVREGLNYTNEGALKSWLKEQGAQLVRAKGAAVVNGRKMLVNYTSGVLGIDACPETIKIGITMIFEKPIIHRNFK